MSHQETVSGLHKCQPKNAPVQGETKNMVVVNMPAKGDKKAWIKIKNELPDKGGTPYRILNVQPLDWPPDTYGNIAFNIEVEASNSQPTAFAKARETMQQGETYDKGQHGREPLEDADPYGQHGEVDEPLYNEPQSPPVRSNGDNGVTEARKHIMQSCNLLNLCIAAVDKAIAPGVPQIAQTSEFFQAQVATLFIEASREVWWSGKVVRESYLSKMPTKPIE